MDLIKTHYICIYISQMIMKMKQKLGKVTDKLVQSIINNTNFWESLTSDVYLNILLKQSTSHTQSTET